MKPSISAGPPSGMLLVLMCLPLLGLVQSANSNKASDNGHPHLGESDPGRCMRHHFVETITHPIYKCNSKVREKKTLIRAVSVTCSFWVTRCLNKVHLTQSVQRQRKARVLHTHLSRSSLYPTVAPVAREHLLHLINSVLFSFRHFIFVSPFFRRVIVCLSGSVYMCVWGWTWATLQTYFAPQLGLSFG